MEEFNRLQMSNNLQYNQQIIERLVKNKLLHFNPDFRWTGNEQRTLQLSIQGSSKSLLIPMLRFYVESDMRRYFRLHRGTNERMKKINDPTEIVMLANGTVGIIKQGDVY